MSNLSTDVVEFNFEAHLKEYDCHLVCEETSHEELAELDKDLPSDTHLVRYRLGGFEYVAAIRAFKMADIFDSLFDISAQVLEISQGYGRIRPNLFGYKPPQSSEKKKKD